MTSPASEPLTQAEVDALPHGTPVTVISTNSHTGIAWPGTIYVTALGSRWFDFGPDIIRLDDVGPPAMTQVRLVSTEAR